MAEADQAFVEYVVKAIVDNPDKVEIKRTVDERGVLLELTVDPDDMGKIIGKAGATAKSIRTLLRVLGAKSDARFNLKIIEPEGSEHVHHEHREENHSEEPAEVEAPAEERDTKMDEIKAKAKEGLEDLDDLDI